MRALEIADCVLLNQKMKENYLLFIQDKKDDVKIGIRSTALLFGSKTKTWLLGFTAVSTTAWLVAGHAAECSWPYHASVMVATGHLLWQIRSVDLENAADCSAKFVSNRWVGACLFLGAIMGRLL
jgi:4-hydroxybenzoate polyprenyltransferase